MFIQRYASTDKKQAVSNILPLNTANYPGAPLPNHPESSSLDSITDNSDISSKPPSIQQYRKQAYKLRHSIIKHLYDKDVDHRIKFCGRSLDLSGVTLAKHGKRAFYAGVAKCGNRWICPVCAAKIAASYKEQLHAYIESAKQAGDRLYFVTLTLQHNKGDRLESLLRQLSDSWNKLNTGRYLQQKQYYITTEVLYGQNGWHPHYHILLNTGQTDHTTDQIEADINRYIVEKWTKLNPGATLQAQNVKQCNSKSIADYLSKNNLAYELTAQNVKNIDADHTKGVHPWHLIGTDKEYLFKEYITATKGKRITRKSKAFFQQYEIAEKTEEQALHEEDVITETIATISNPVYNELRRKGRLCDILEAAEGNDPDILFAIGTALDRGVYMDFKSKSIHFDDHPLPTGNS